MRLLALLAAGLFAGAMIADDKKDDKKVKDEEAILGTWKVEGIDSGTSEKLPADYFEKVRLNFRKDGKLTAAGTDGKDKNQTFKLDPAAKPKTIDIITEDGQEVPGLYELDGDTLKHCISLVPKDQKFPRPTEFKADGKGVVVMTLKRVKEEKK